MSYLVTTAMVISGFPTLLRLNLSGGPDTGPCASLLPSRPGRDRAGSWRQPCSGASRQFSWSLAFLGYSCARHMFGRAKNGRAMLGEPVPPGQYSRSRGRFRGCIRDIASSLAWVGSETTYPEGKPPQVAQGKAHRANPSGATS